MLSIELYKKYGNPFDTKDEGSYMTVWDVPEYLNIHLPTVPNRIYCHKDMVIPLETAFLFLINRGLSNELKTWDGCFNVRIKRGQERKFNKRWSEGKYQQAFECVSVHSWGCAIDVNAAWNGMGKAPQMSKEFVQCFKDAGFEWGGDWRIKDGMHFQLSYVRPKSRL